jgi:hypothetical protein
MDLAIIRLNIIFGKRTSPKAIGAQKYYYGKIIHGWGSFYYLILDVLYCNFWRKKQPENSSMKSKYACVASRDISL